MFQTQWAGGFPGASAEVSIAVGGEWHFHESQSWARNHAAPYHSELVVKAWGRGGSAASGHFESCVSKMRGKLFFGS